MEWDEFTRFVVVKAQLHHAQMSIDQLAEYHQGSRQVRKNLAEDNVHPRTSAAKYRITSFCSTT